MVIHLFTKQNSLSRLYICYALIMIICTGCSKNKKEIIQDSKYDANKIKLESEISNSMETTTGAERGWLLYDEIGCSSCHQINEHGGTFGPDLSIEARRDRTREWLKIKIKSHNEDNLLLKKIMPSYDYLTDEQINDIVDFLMTLTKKKIPDIVVQSNYIMNENVISL